MMIFFFISDGSPVLPNSPTYGNNETPPLPAPRQKVTAITPKSLNKYNSTPSICNSDPHILFTNANYSL